jgi:E3 ubiquitin-protein ligase RAD18
MDNAFEIPDSTDWLNTPLSLVTPLESALRCQVCKDFFDNPVITSCCHTFCSLCIRRCLSAEGKCPACRSPDQEMKLRRNWAVQEIVDSFRNARPNILSLARQRASAEEDGEAEDDLEQPPAKKRRLDRPDNASESRSEGRKTRSQGKRSDSQTPTTQYEVIEDSEDDDFVPGKLPYLAIWFSI